MKQLGLKRGCEVKYESWFQRSSSTACIKHADSVCDASHMFLKSHYKAQCQRLQLSPSWQCLISPNCQLIQKCSKRWSMGGAVTQSSHIYNYA